MPPVLDLSSVSVIRDGNPILNDVSWTVNEGERWVVLGPNGAGKSTLLGVAAARMFPTSGVASILGDTLGAVDVFELRPRIGLSSASLADRIPFDETVENVVLTASYGVVGRFTEEYEGVDADRARSQMEFMGVDHLAARTFGSLSEGERKRTLLARALMADPELMLLDEPSAGLDLGAREDLLLRLTDLARDPSSPAMVMVTHHVEEIPAGFTHALLIAEGFVTSSGPIREALTAQALADTFGMCITLEHYRGRWSAQATSPPEQ